MSASKQHKLKYASPGEDICGFIVLYWISETNKSANLNIEQIFGYKVNPSFEKIR